MTDESNKTTDNNEIMKKVLSYMCIDLGGVPEGQLSDADEVIEKAYKYLEENDDKSLEHKADELRWLVECIREDIEEYFHYYVEDGLDDDIEREGDDDCFKEKIHYRYERNGYSPKYGISDWFIHDIVDIVDEHVTELTQYIIDELEKK